MVRDGKGLNRSRLTDDQNIGIVLGLAFGRSMGEIAEEVGCGVATVYRRASDEGVQELVKRAREKLLDAALGKLAAHAEEAVDTIISVMRGAPQPEQQRLAAESVLKNSGARDLAERELGPKPSEGRGDDRPAVLVPVILDPRTGMLRRLLPGEQVVDGEVRVLEEGKGDDGSDDAEE